PSVTMVKTQTPASPNPGDVVTYRLVVTNNGNVVLTSLAVTDTVSAIVTGGAQVTPVGFAALAPANVAGGTWFAWSGTGLSFGPGQALTFPIPGTVSQVCAPVTVANVAFASAGSVCGAASAVSNTTSFPVTPPVTSVTVAKQQVTAGGAGAAITYRVIVTNTGTATVTSVTVTDT